jgi:lysyl-tRNA synthetase class II
MAKSMKPISPPLYSVDSFASNAAMESTSSQLKQAYDIDQAYAATKHQARRDFRDKMQRVDPGYLRGFESKMHSDDALEASIEAEEAKWVASAMSLYDFAAAHAGEITVDNGGHLVIANEELKQRLLQKIDASTVLRQTMMNDRAKAVKNQHTLQNAMEMKHSD